MSDAWRRLATPVYWASGWTCVGLGALGLFLPLLPTTPFLLVAAWCFDRSSPRLHAWLLRTPALGSMLVEWKAHGAIRLRAKVACTVVLVAFGVMAWWRGSPAWALLVMALVSACSMTFVWTRPSGPRAPADSRDGREARIG